MIPCTDFIPAYSELFKTLEDLGGEEAVEDFWRTLSEEFLGNLRDHVERFGLEGCWEYWSHTLNEEAADFTMTLDLDEGIFRIDMHCCPSKRRLLECPHVEPYRAYCRHCDLLYRNILEALGYSYSIDLSRCDEARCSITVTEGAGSRSGEGL